MPYVAEKDVNLPRVIARGTDPEGNEFTETESVVYAQGAVIQDDDIADDVRERLESGDDDHLSSLVSHVSESEAQDLLAQQGGGPVAPEHEAEAEVLYQDGQDVLTREEVVESNPNGDPPAVEEEVPDMSEGRDSEDPESIRSTEVDAERRGEGEAPEPVPAAEEGEAKPKRGRGRAKKQEAASGESSE